MKLAIVTAFPPSKVTLNEYGYHLVKQFRLNDKVDELILLTDEAVTNDDVSFEEHGCKIVVKNCWKFNSYKNIFSINRAVKETKPDAVLFNLQFLKFWDKKIPAALGLLTPYMCKLKDIPTIVLLHNILEQVDLNSAGFTKNKLLQKAYGLIGTIITKFLLSADLVALTIQKFGTYKKVEVMIEAVEGVRKNTSEDLEIVVAGTDSPNTPGYIDSMKEKYKNVPGFRFTGYVAEEDVPIIFNESTVVVFPYTSTTGSSGVLHQAGSCGKDVIMPNLGDLTDLIEDEGYRGEYFEADDVGSLAKAIKKVVENDSYRLELAKANYKAAASLPMSEIAEMYLKYFEAIQEKKKK